jgi:hypothetical protein
MIENLKTVYLRACQTMIGPNEEWISLMQSTTSPLLYPLSWNSHESIHRTLSLLDLVNMSLLSTSSLQEPVL